MNKITAPPPLSLATIMLVGLLTLPSWANEGWSVVDGENPELPGRRVDVKQDGQLVASLVYGEGQQKPYLNVYGEQEALLTNPGMNEQGETTGLYPHHRGIFIGWNRIQSELGETNLWGMGGRARQELIELERLEPGEDSATIVARIKWRAGQADEQGSNVLLVERRELTVSRPDGRTQIDASFTLEAARDLRLDGDLQHAGIHFRAHDEVAQRADETAYLWQPDLPGGGGRIVNPDDLQWIYFRFPIGDNWYSALQLNAPTNPVEELSWRDYGRFGFFFKRDISAGESLELNYRFLVQPTEPPADPPGFSAEEAARVREAAQVAYQKYQP